MEYIIISILLGVIVVLSYFVWKLLDRLQKYDNTMEELILELNNMADAIEVILSREIYSNDAIIINFVDRLRDIQNLIRNLTPEFEFNQLGEKTDG